MNKLSEIIACCLFLILVFTFFTGGIVKGTSMEDSFVENELFIALKKADLEVGDVVVVEIDQKRVIKRIVAKEGDVISRDEERRLLINGKMLNKEAFNFSTEDIVLQEEEYFIVGDNYRASIDSRDIGPVKRENILGKVIIKFDRDKKFFTKVN